MKIGRPERFGETSPVEQEIVKDIIFRRETKRQTFESIAGDLNAAGRWPRRAPKWGWALVRYFYVQNKGKTNVDSKEIA